MCKCKDLDLGFWHNVNHRVENIQNYKRNKDFSRERYSDYVDELPEGYAFAKQSVLDSELVETLYGI